MPRYTFINTITNEEETVMMTISERSEYLSSNPHIKQKLSTPGLPDPIRIGVTKPDAGFTDVLNNIKKRYHKSTIET